MKSKLLLSLVALLSCLTIVTDGVGIFQAVGKKAQVLRKGDVVHI